LVRLIALQQALYDAVDAAGDEEVERFVIILSAMDPGRITTAAGLRFELSLAELINYDHINKLFPVTPDGTHGEAFVTEEGLRWLLSRGQQHRVENAAQRELQDQVPKLREEAGKHRVDAASLEQADAQAVYERLAAGPDAQAIAEMLAPGAGAGAGAGVGVDAVASAMASIARADKAKATRKANKARRATTRAGLPRRQEMDAEAGRMDTVTVFARELSGEAQYRRDELRWRKRWGVDEVLQQLYRDASWRTVRSFDSATALLAKELAALGPPCCRGPRQPYAQYLYGRRRLVKMRLRLSMAKRHFEANTAKRLAGMLRRKWAPYQRRLDMWAWVRSNWGRVARKVLPSGAAVPRLSTAASERDASWLLVRRCAEKFARKRFPLEQYRRTDHGAAGDRADEEQAGPVGAGAGAGAGAETLGGPVGPGSPRGMDVEDAHQAHKRSQPCEPCEGGEECEELPAKRRRESVSPAPGGAEESKGGGDSEYRQHSDPHTDAGIPDRRWSGCTDPSCCHRRSADSQACHRTPHRVLLNPCCACCPIGEYLHKRADGSRHAGSATWREDVRTRTQLMERALMGSASGKRVLYIHALGDGGFAHNSRSHPTASHWGLVRQMVAQGAIAASVDEFRTSKLCCVCAAEVTMDSTSRQVTCPKCKKAAGEPWRQQFATRDRDLNGVLNIAIRAIRVLASVRRYRLESQDMLEDICIPRPWRRPRGGSAPARTMSA